MAKFSVVFGLRKVTHGTDRKQDSAWIGGLLCLENMRKADQ